MQTTISPENQIVLLCIALLGLAYWAATLPGNIARTRRHPHRDAISLCGLIGAFIWPMWLVALVWAHTVPTPAQRPVLTDGELGWRSLSWLGLGIAVLFLSLLAWVNWAEIAQEIGRQ